jgi:hypothetical protein
MGTVPVTLVWAIPKRERPIVPPHGPGFMSFYGEIYLPLSRQVGLIGRSQPGIVVATREAVAILNTRVINESYRCVYSPTLEFKWVNRTGSEVSGTELIGLKRESKISRDQAH